jgi:hypothetical protein
MGELRNAYKILVRRPELKRTLGRPRHKWEDIIKIYQKNMLLRCGLNLSGSGQRQETGFCEHGNELSGSIKGG